MFELLSELSDWVVGFADSDWAALVLGVTAFIESIFFPIPPDPLLIGIGIRQPELVIWLAALTTAASVAGAVIGHWLGSRFGKPLLHRFVSEHKVARVESLFQKYGMWAILLAAFTPIPYKVFAITAGVLGLDRRTFIIASIIGRGARFFLIAGLIVAFGDSIEEFIESNFELVTAIVAAGVVVVGVFFLLVMRIRRAGKVPG